MSTNTNTNTNTNTAAAANWLVNTRDGDGRSVLDVLRDNRGDWRAAIRARVEALGGGRVKRVGRAAWVECAQTLTGDGIVGACGLLGEANTRAVLDLWGFSPYEAPSEFLESNWALPVYEDSGRLGGWREYGAAAVVWLPIWSGLSDDIIISLAGYPCLDDYVYSVVEWEYAEACAGSLAEKIVDTYCFAYDVDEPAAGALERAAELLLCFAVDDSSGWWWVDSGDGLGRWHASHRAARLHAVAEIACRGGDVADAERVLRAVTDWAAVEALIDADALRDMRRAW